MNLHILFSKRNSFSKTIRIKYNEKEYTLIKNILYTLEINDFEKDFIEIEYYGHFYKYDLKKFNLNNNDNLEIIKGFDSHDAFGNRDFGFYFFIIGSPILLLLFIFGTKYIRKFFLSVNKKSDNQLGFKEQIFLE